jgi:hypothetical protein
MTGKAIDLEREDHLISVSTAVYDARRTRLLGVLPAIERLSLGIVRKRRPEKVLCPCLEQLRLS